jgi:hypothetical protein
MSIRTLTPVISICPRLSGAKAMRRLCGIMIFEASGLTVT